MGRISRPNTLEEKKQYQKIRKKKQKLKKIKEIKNNDIIEKEERNNLFPNIREIKFNELESVEQEIGKGAFGTVRSMKWRGMSVAVKSIQGKSSGRNIIQEAHFLSTCHQFRIHPNLIYLIGININKKLNCSSMITELCSFNGEALNIFDALFERNIEYLEDLCEKIILDVAAGLKQIHTCNILHNDLHMRNILLHKNSKCTTAVICDFGLSSKVSSGRKLHSSNSKKSPHIAPELYEGKPPSLQSDIYSFGVVLKGFKQRYSKCDALYAVISHCTDASPSNRPCDMSLVVKQIKKLNLDTYILHI